MIRFQTQSALNLFLLVISAHYKVEDTDTVCPTKRRASTVTTAFINLFLGCNKLRPLRLRINCSITIVTFAQPTLLCS